MNNNTNNYSSNKNFHSNNNLQPYEKIKITHQNKKLNKLNKYLLKKSLYIK